MLKRITISLFLLLPVSVSFAQGERSDYVTKSSTVKKASEKSIFGEYLRTQILETHTAEHRVFGQINNYCSGTLIGPKHVLTAAHCVLDHEKGEWSEEPYFVPGRASISDTPLGGADWAKIYLLKDYVESEGQIENDFAVIELRKNIGDELGWIPLLASDEAQKEGDFFITGYPGDKPMGTMWEVYCPGLFVDSIVAHRCDTIGGMSGSAVYSFDGEGNRTIGGVHTSGGQEFNKGSRITKETFDIIMSWTKNENRNLELDGKINDRSIIRTNVSKELEYDKIEISNSCSKEINFAIRFVNLQEEWVINAWYSIAPGETAYVANTLNATIYVYAMTFDKAIHWPGKDLFDVGDSSYRFLKLRNPSPIWGIYQKNYTCD